MKIGIPRETFPGETRVALVPAALAPLLRDHHEVVLATGAGSAAGFADEAYAALGVRLAPDAEAACAGADAIFRVQPPSLAEAAGLRSGVELVCHLAPFAQRPLLEALAAREVTAWAMEFVPRITRAQSMDALSSQATVAGYKSVLLAAAQLGKMFPLLMTAAGTITPAQVLVLGAGVAGLQAIATARRLGAKVEAFDPRPAVREQVKSLGAVFVEMELPKDAETAGGYAKELSPEFIRKEMEAIGGRLPRSDVLICTAQVFGKRAPLLVDTAMVERMRPGSVVVDLAAEQGGNCELTRAGQTVVHRGVTILGPVNLPASVPADASALYARNVVNLFRHLHPKPGVPVDFADEIARGCCLARGGAIVHAGLRQAYGLPPLSAPAAAPA